MSYDTFHRWINKFISGLESIETAPKKSGRPKFASCGEIVSKVKYILEEMLGIQYVI